MGQNLVDTHLTPDDWAIVDEAIARIQATIEPLMVPVTPTDKKFMVKMGNGSEVFCRTALEVMGENVALMPRSFDLEEMRRDLTSHDALNARIVKLMRLLEKMRNTEMALGSDVMVASLEGYAVLKAVGKGEGVRALRKMLSRRFAGSGRAAMRRTTRRTRGRNRRAEPGPLQAGKPRACGAFSCRPFTAQASIPVHEPFTRAPAPCPVSGREGTRRHNPYHSSAATASMVARRMCVPRAAAMTRMHPMKPCLSMLSLLLGAALTIAMPQASAQTSGASGLSSIPDRRPGEFNGHISEYFKDSERDFPLNPTPPAGAPNVILILLDDVGFGATSTFGGPVATPALDKLAARGLRYTQWHTTALCAPTRAAILTGQNHHEAGFGGIPEVATGFPGYNGILPDTSVTVGQILRDNGYNTAWFGKNHNTPDYETSQAGPFRQWPNAMGFEYFYGFIGGDTNQWAPALTENTRPVEPPADDPDYHLTTDLADRAISWIRNQQSTAPNKPFFVYFAPGATHAPHHAPKAWIDRFKGQFDQGWNAVSRETFERMREQGIIPASARHNPLPGEVTDWDALEADRKKVYARMMEVYAGFLAHTDHEIGRMLDAVEDLGAADDTLVIYAVGDNGASAEGGFTGTLNEIAADFNSYRPDVVADAMGRLDEIGGPTTYNHYPVGWAMAMNSPMRLAKRQASHFGGTRNGLVIAWPGHIDDEGALRTQFHHAVDITPTILQATGIQAPRTANGIEQKPMAGVSMAYTFDAAGKDAPSRRTTQYFEIGGTRAIYDNGWIAATTHGLLPWSDEASEFDFENDPWELYDLSQDFTEFEDVARQHPEKLAELKAKFMDEARKRQVLPLNDQNAALFNARVAGRPAGPVEGLDTLTYYPGMVRLPEGSAPDVKNRSYTLTADIEIPAGGANGILVTQGGLFSGWALMLQDSRPAFVYNWMQEDFTTISGDPLPPGKHTVAFDFTYDGGGLGKGGTGVLTVDGRQVAQQRIERTVPNRFSLDETMDVGQDTGTAVSPDYRVPNAFTGTLEKVVVELK